MARSRPSMHLCSFTEGLDELPRTKQKSAGAVLRHLHKAKRFSVFEATANEDVAKTMTALLNGKLIEVDNSPGYPWSNVKLTEAGKKLAGVE